MKFGLKQLFEKTPKALVKFGLALKSATGTSIPFVLAGSKIAATIAILALLGAFLIAFCGEDHVDKPSS